MRHIYTSFSVLVFCMLISACRGDLVGVQDGTALEVNAVIAGSEAVVEDDYDTKAIINGSTPANGFDFGLFACKHEDHPGAFVPFADKTLNNNIRCVRSSNRWYWAYESQSSTTFTPLTFMSNDPENEHLDFYAYAPWKGGVYLKQGLYIDVTTSTDVMYATFPAKGQSGSNLDREIVEKSFMPLDITFHHALSCVNFYFKIKNPQSLGYDGTHSIALSSICFQKKGDTPLYKEAVLNLVTNELTPYETAQQSISYTMNKAVSSATSWSSASSILVYPTEYQADDDYLLSFFFNTSTTSEALMQTYKIKKSDLIHSDGTTVGFKAGYTYSFYFIVDNYIHLQNVVVSDDWGLFDAKEQEILM